MSLFDSNAAEERPHANITPAVLRWAREQSKLTVEEAAKKIGVKPERYANWEDEESSIRPTFPQLRKTAKVLHRPPSLFYLATPPDGFKPIQDLRQSNEHRGKPYSTALVYEMELAQQHRENSLELFRVLGERTKPFSISADIDESPEIVGQRIRSHLGIDFNHQREWRANGELNPFNAWRRAIESLDVLVFQMSRVDWTEVSGFALAEETLPIIVVNRKDAANRRTFSLIHELAHLMLGQSSASDLDIGFSGTFDGAEIEVFCNAVAGAALVPRDDLLNQAAVRAHRRWSEDWTDADIGILARAFGVSKIVVLRRLLVFGKTTKRFYENLSSRWKKEFEAYLAEKKQRLQRELNSEGNSFRTNPPQDVILNFGKPYVGLVLDSLNSSLISINEASRLLGDLRVRHFEKLEQNVFDG